MFCKIRNDLMEQNLSIPTRENIFLHDGTYKVINQHDISIDEFNLEIYHSESDKIYHVMSIDFDFI